jgi:hypothetical protein
MRAAAPDLDFKPDFNPTKTAKAGKLAEIEREIAAETVTRIREQYHYDAVQSRKHLVVAQAYVRAAAEAVGFDLDPAMAANIPSVTADVDLEEYVEDELRVRIDSMGKFVESKRKELAKALDAKR